MALQLSTEVDQTGFTGDYYKITGVNIDAVTSKGEIILELYKSATARANGKKPVSTTRFKTSSQVFSVANMDGQNPLTLSYNYLKTLPEFAGAVDV